MNFEKEIQDLLTNGLSFEEIADEFSYVMNQMEKKQKDKKKQLENKYNCAIDIAVSALNNAIAAYCDYIGKPMLDDSYLYNRESVNAAIRTMHMVEKVADNCGNAFNRVMNKFFEENDI